MKIDDRIQLVKDMLAENPDQLAISLPTHTVETLLEYCRDRAELKKAYNQQACSLRYYKEEHKYLKAQLRRSN